MSAPDINEFLERVALALEVAMKAIGLDDL